MPRAVQPKKSPDALLKDIGETLKQIDARLAAQEERQKQLWHWQMAGVLMKFVMVVSILVFTSIGGYIYYRVITGIMEQIH